MMSRAPNMLAGAAVSLSGISVAYATDGGDSVAAVTAADLDIEAGSIVALLGPSGCGKTSLLRAIAGLESPTAGSASIGGATVSSHGSGKRQWVNPEKRNVGMVFQDGALFPHLTVAQNIVFGLRAMRKELSRAEVLARVDELLDLVDLQGFGDRLPNTLSGGQQQRVALARSLAPQPKVLLLDEPFSALDTSLRVQVRAEVARIVRDVGVTTVFVTHDQDEAFVLGDKVAVMQAGNIEQFGTPDELYRSPATPWVAGFVGEANFVVGVVADNDATVAATPIGVITIDDRRADPNSNEVRVLVRPEQVSLRLDPTDGAEAATVRTVEYYGHDVRYEVEFADGTVLAARTHSTELYERGDMVYPSFQSRQRGSTSAAFSVDRTDA
ncbi:MAG: iron(III) transport system ATP-binding protein [Ilumatobacter sp.]|jgi:iron(III) transport system ATP-binding protein